MANFVPDFVHQGIDSVCCQCWQEGCGCDSGFALCADCLEYANPVLEQVGDVIWIFGSPLAFCCIFCFSSAPHTDESSGYELSMLQAPIRRPLTCCAASFCAPCGQWYVRRKVLGGDMTKYKLWQGYHDGPKCCPFIVICSIDLDTSLQESTQTLDITIIYGLAKGGSSQVLIHTQ